MDRIEKEKRRRRFLRVTLPQIGADLIKLAVIVVFMFPVWWLFVTSFKTYGEATAGGFTLWPKNFTWANYHYILFELNIDVLHFLKNSIIIIIGIIAIQLLTMVPAAYAFAKQDFFFKGELFGVVLIAFMMPVQVTFLTTYVQMAGWKLLQTLWPQILPFGANAFGMFLLRQSFKQIPDEIIESSRLDGASELKTLIHVLLPMTKATLVTIALFSFVSHWNAYFWPLAMTNTDKVRPLMLMVKQLSTSIDGEPLQWNIVMAANMLLVLPVMVLYVFLNKTILRSYGYKGVK